ATWVGELKKSPSGYTKLIRMLKAWSTSAPAREALISHVITATFDPLSLRTALEDVGPRPNVNLLLFVPGSLARQTPIEPLRDIDIALVYRGGSRAAEEVDDLATAMTPKVSVP